MKKTIIFVVFAMVMIYSCAAQSANDAQRLVGTWVSEDNRSTFVFNANGTGTYTGSDSKTENRFWGVTFTGEIFISETGNYGSLFKFALSPDGKRLFWGNSMYLKK